MTTALRVAIVGAGPGGLTLAQGLLKKGLRVTVYEKARVRDDYVQGFRLRIRERGIQALRTCLPPHLYQAFEATTGRSPIASVSLDEQLQPLPDAKAQALPGDVDDAHAGKSVSRITLRQVLLGGLDAHIRYGAEFSHYATQADGSVVLHFNDGSSAIADVVVGADGINSRVRQQLLPEARVFDTGVRRLAGKIRLQDARALGLLPLFFEQQVGIRPSNGRGHGLMISAHRVDAEAYNDFGLIGSDDPGLSASHGDDLHFSNSASYLWWNTAFRQDELASDAVLEQASGVQLLELLVDHLQGWHPELLKLLRHSHPSTVAALKVRSSEPPAPWPTGRVTLLGDAIHAMTYFRALGGNTAIFDAGLLTQELAAAQRGDKPLLSALQDYELAMQAHGFAAVRLSLQALERSLGPARQPALEAQP